MGKTIIISASDARFHPLLEGLHHSIRADARRDGMDLGVLDLGLNEEQRRALDAEGTLLRTPELDHDPAIFRIAPRPTFRAMTARPHLPKYFPGYDVYVFLDADCWVQDWQAVRLYVTEAQRVGLSVTPECDRSYTPFLVGMSVQEWRYQTFLTCFGEVLAKELSQFPMINTGLFAARADSNVWASWAEVLGNLLKALGEPFFYAEQTVLNALIRKGLVAAAYLPARCNWMCNLAAPMCSTDGKILCEPQPPFEPLGIIHLTGPNKTEAVTLKDVTGGTHSRSLRFQGVVSELPC
jgi:hypothetical protein